MSAGRLLLAFALAWALFAALGTQGRLFGVIICSAV